MIKKNMFNLALSQNSITIRFSATLENVDESVVEIKKFIGDVIQNEDIFAIVLAVREALTNSVKHGCKFDPHKKVMFSLQLENNKIMMEIEDEGNGFDWHTHIKRKKKVPILETSGRGIKIMKAYFPDVKFNEKGNKLTFKKNIN